MLRPTQIWVLPLLLGLAVRTASTQDDFAARLQNASAQGDVEALGQLVQQLNQSQPSDLQDVLATCFEQPSQCAGDNAPRWCSAFNSVLRRPTECFNVLHTAALTWQAASVEYLLSDSGPGMDVNARTNMSNTPLSLAFQGFDVYYHPCQAEFRDTVLTLLAKGADPRLPYPYAGLSNYTVLHFEAYDGNRHGLIADIVNAGADVNQIDDRGYTALHSAAKCDFRLSCDACGCSYESQSCRSAADTAESGSSNVTDVPCPNPSANISDNAPVQFFGAAPTLQYLVMNGGNPVQKGFDGKRPIDLVPAPPVNTSDFTAWLNGNIPENYRTGTCLATYLYLYNGTNPSPQPSTN